MPARIQQRSTIIKGLLVATLVTALGLGGCAAAGHRASPERLPKLTPRVLSTTSTNLALASLSKAKEPGKDNMLFSLTFVEPPPKELMPSWATLDNAFSQLAGTGITYLPMDFFNLRRQPTPLPSNAAAMMTSGDPKVPVEDGNGVIRYQLLDHVKTTFADAMGKDGKLQYLRLRMSLAYDRGVQTRNRGLIIRALAKVGAEEIEPDINVNDDSETGRITVTLGYVDENGAIGKHNVIVNTDVTRLGAEDRFGMIVSSNGGVYYDKATVSHGLAGAVNETVGHAVFILLSKVMGLNYEQLLAESAGGPAIMATGKSEPGGTSSIKTIRVVKGAEHDFGTGERLAVIDIHGNSVVVQSVAADGSVSDRRLFVGDRLFVRDSRLGEVRSVDLRAIQFGTTAEFRETIMARQETDSAS